MEANEAPDNDALGASYRLIERIGSGGSGEVWRAIDIRTDEPVAAKLLRSEHVADPSLVERFVRERSILTGLRHPNIVAVRDLVVEGDRLAIVMDFVGGGSLRDILQHQRTLPPRMAATITASILEGLAAAHGRRVLHRDIKPDNVLLRTDWHTERPDAVKVTDFGIAQIISEGPRTTTGLLGTPEYMSPELITIGEAGPAADVYGAGILLYELLAGRTPFAGPGTDFTIAYRHVSAQLPQIAAPTELWELLQRLLDKDPRARLAAADAADRLRQLAPQYHDHAALAPVTGPDGFAPTDRPATAMRGVTDNAEQQANHSGHNIGPAPDLGIPGKATIHKPLLHTATISAEPAENESPPSRPWWKNPRMIIAAAAALVVLIAAGVLAIQLAPRRGSPDPPVAARLQATQLDQPTPTGLGISRQAEYDASTATIALTITYSAQKAPLRGPFLEVLPAAAPQAPCPSVTWSDAEQQRNLPSVTGITRPCGWSIDGVEVEAETSTDVSVSVHQPIASAEELQNWLDAAAAGTADAVEDTEVTGTAYPVQRLQDIQVTTPARTVSETTLPVTLVPVWPSGDDAVNPLYKSPSVGEPSKMLMAIAGGADGVRFSDGCSGAVSVSSDKRTVTALSQVPECRINAQVGNFTDLESSPFAIVTRGG